MTLAAELRAGIRALGLTLSSSEAERLLAYQALLAKWNAVYNLTAIRDPEQMLTHHLLDSLAVLPSLPQRPSLRLIDVGSGGGLPGIPLAIVQPSWQVRLLDSNQKKTTFLQQAIMELQLSNAQVVCARVEAFDSAEKFDVVISRAFADLGEFVRLAGHLVASDGQLVAMKGVHPQAELALLPPPWKAVAVNRLRVPGMDAERHLVKLLKAA